MNNKNARMKILWGISMIGSLAVSYWICRFAFFELHGMAGWSNLLAIVSLVTIVIATIFGNRIISIAPVIGYITGFVIAMIFSTDGTDPGGGTTNNAWIIWGAVLIVSILLGFLLSYISTGRREILTE